MNRTLINNKLVSFMLTMILLLGGIIPVHAASSDNSDRWKVTGALYLWYASMGGNTTTGSGVNVDASDLIDNLDFAFMGLIDVRKQKWSFMADVIYLSVEAGEQGSVTLPTAPTVPIPVNANVDIEGWVVTLTGGHALIQPAKNRLDLRFGARYLQLKSKLDLALNPPSGPTISLSDSSDIWDAVIGIDGRFGLTDKWYLPYYLDVGTGNSKMTWQAFGGVAYAFRKVDVVVAYRHLEWDFDDDPLLDDVNFNGPFAGIAFRF